MYVAQLLLISYIDPKGLRVTKNAYFSLLTPTKQLELLTLCDAGNGSWMGWHADRRKAATAVRADRRER